MKYEINMEWRRKNLSQVADVIIYKLWIKQTLISRHFKVDIEGTDEHKVT